MPVPLRYIPLSSAVIVLWLLCQATGVIWSVLRLVGMVSLRNDWVK